MDGVLKEVRSLSTCFTSSPWSFDTKFKRQCKDLLKQAVALCAQDSLISTLASPSLGGDWWKGGLGNGLLAVLVRVHSLLQDCSAPSTPTYDYSARDFWSLWLELSWYEKLVESSSLHPSLEISNLDSMCLNDDLYRVMLRHNPEPRTRDSCEIVEPGMVDFKEDGIIRNRELIGRVHKVSLRGIEGCIFASKTIDPSSLEEIDIHLKLDHPNIVRMKAWCRIGMPVPLLVIELMDRDLRKWIDEQHPLVGAAESRFKNKSRFNWEYMVVAIDILHQIAQAMRYVQRCGVAHRDLKTDNILVREEMHEGRRVSYFVTAKVADFGTSKVTKDGWFTTEKRGTRKYRAPEVMKAEQSGKYSFKADVWSFGVIGWEVLTGGTPSEDAMPQEWPKGGWIHPYLKGCIQRCWEREPGERPSFESICITMQHLKRSMFRNKGIYHTSATVLAGKSPHELAKQYQMFQKDMDKWWMAVLAKDIQPSKSLIHFNPQGFSPQRVRRFLDKLLMGNLSQHSFLLCKCYYQLADSMSYPASPLSDPSASSFKGAIINNEIGVQLAERSCTSHSSASPTNNSSTAENGVQDENRNMTMDICRYLSDLSWDYDDLLGQEFCSQTAFENAALLACSFVEVTVQACKKETCNSIKLLFKRLAARLHQRQYGWETCSSNHHFL